MDTITSETQKTVIARTMRLEYEPSQTGYETGVKGWYKKWHRGGYRTVAGGCGTYITATPSHLVLEIEINGTTFKVWTERDFRRLLDTKRLTPQLREKIEAAMPESVEVVEREGQRGTKYYVLSEKSAQEWADRITR